MRDETISYKKVTGHTHRLRCRTSAVAGACGLFGPPEGGPVIHYRHTLQINTGADDGERGEIYRKSFST